MKKIVLSLSILFLAAGFAVSQQKNAYINFETLHHDYGKINEEKGPVEYKFVFTNTGSKPLIIQRVKPSCGCTTSDYTKQPVPPGGKGFVIASYNPKNRPGRFNKSISVTTNSDKPVTVLRISGDVIPKPKSVEDIYPRSFGKIRLTRDHVAFTKILNTEVQVQETEIINTSSEPVKLNFQKIPQHISINVEPPVLMPGKKGVIKVSFDAKKVNDFGFIIEKVMVKENDDPRINKLTVTANVHEDFSHLTKEELAMAPAVSFDKRSFNFGEITQGEIASTSFTLSNTGKSNLLIRKTKSTCGCTVVKPQKDIIKPGESVDIKATFNSRGRKGKQSKNITVYTNDPNNPVSTLKIGGIVNPKN